MAPFVASMALDPNANHVVQRFLENMRSADCQFIMDVACAQCAQLSTHRHGCCVMYWCFERASDKQCEELVARIMEHALEFCEDPFGNYVIQHVLAKGTWQHACMLARKLLGHIPRLACQKFR